MGSRKNHAISQGGSARPLDEYSPEELAALAKDALELRQSKLDPARKALAAEFKAAVASLETEHRVALKTARRNLEEEFERRAAALDTTLRALTGPRSKTAGRKFSAKYWDEVMGKTWSGQGKKPRWVRDYEAQGRSLEEFLIREGYGPPLS